MLNGTNTQEDSKGDIWLWPPAPLLVIFFSNYDRYFTLLLFCQSNNLKSKNLWPWPFLLFLFFYFFLGVPLCLYLYDCTFIGLYMLQNDTKPEMQLFQYYQIYFWQLPLSIKVTNATQLIFPSFELLFLLYWTFYFLKKCELSHLRLRNDQDTMIINQHNDSWSLN